MKTVHLDANVLLRFLRNDHDTHSPQARELIAAAVNGKVRLCLSVLTLAEVFYAFRASYKLERPRIAGLLQDILGSGAFAIEQEPLVSDALARVCAANVDFGDAMLAAQASAHGETVATFDTDFTRFPDLKLHPWH